MSSNPAVDELARLSEWDGASVAVAWAKFESALGLGLPDDFKALAEAFPYGVFQDWVRPVHPTLARDAAGWVASLRVDCNALRLWRDDFVPDFGYGIYPESGGLVPWAEMDHDVFFCWVTEGPPNGWPTVVCNRSLKRGEAHPMGAASFLVGLFDGTVDEPMLADWREDFAQRPVDFEAF